jgi:hypothetical protein
MAKTNELDLIDFKKLGACLRFMRKTLGYERAEDFSAALYEIAGYQCTKDFIYRVESGRQETPLSYLVALSIFDGNGVFNNDEMGTYLEMSLTPHGKKSLKARESMRGQIAHEALRRSLADDAKLEKELNTSLLDENRGI